MFRSVNMSSNSVFIKINTLVRKLTLTFTAIAKYQTKHIDDDAKSFDHEDDNSRITRHFWSIYTEKLNARVGLHTIKRVFISATHQDL